METNSAPSPDLSLQISPPNNSLFPANTDLSLSTQPIIAQQRYQNPLHEQKTMLYPIFHGNNPTNLEYPFTNISSPVSGMPSIGPCYSRAGPMVTRLNGFPVLDFPCGRLDTFDPSHGYLMNSRFMVPKIPAKRSTRAPRMRWTSSLHARFVRAVELLGGHESMISLSLSLTQPSLHKHAQTNFFFSSFFWFQVVISAFEAKKEIKKNKSETKSTLPIVLFFVRLLIRF